MEKRTTTKGSHHFCTEDSGRSLSCSAHNPAAAAAAPENNEGTLDSRSLKKRKIFGGIDGRLA